MIPKDLSNILATLPDEALIPVGWVRARLDTPLPEETIGDLSCSDVAAALHKKRGTVRGWCARKEIEGAYLLNGKTWMIPRKSLRAYLDKQAAGSPKTGAPVDLGSWRNTARRSH